MSPYARHRCRPFDRTGGSDIGYRLVSGTHIALLRCLKRSILSGHVSHNQQPLFV
ncbi:hypothetical protein Csa_016664 [Cucumis sativus]|uniref:Uncharacterized protein n=1 Tax=Cucumis sativus TaxID=3659 RepID=A0A0A0K895_CUCSA|nr:hypothetical protein Csa_016664 [Cucumis sativus]